MRKIIKTGLGLIIAFVVIYFIINASYEANIIYDLYTSLDNRTSDSKANFDKKLYFVTTDENGNKIVTIGFQSETEYESGVKRFGDAYDDGENNNSTDASDVYDSELTYGEPISTELADYVNSNYTMWSCSDGESKKKSLSAVYYTLNNAGISKECIAGILGNIMHEGNSGQFEKIPYGWDKRAYYRNSWENVTIYSQFPTRSGISQDRVYSEVFSNKQAFNVDMTYAELYSMFNITVTTNQNIFGFGPIQATSPSWQKKYMNALENLNLHTSTNGILYEDILAVDAEVCNIGAQATFSNGIPSEGKNLRDYDNSYNDVINAVIFEMGTLTNAEKDVVKASAYWTACVEVCGDYTKLNTLKSRAVSSVKAYRCMNE